MKLYDELKARGLVAQITDEEIIDVINEGKATFYIGFDCTADSLTAGHFMALTLMKRLQMAGNKPIALIGGGTTMIGDPSGRTDMRKMLTKEDIDHNAACFKRQMERFIDFSEGKALMLNNADWLLKLNYIELLREVGACFSVNNMLRAECYKQRMEKGLSFLEFNYMIMQSYDFYYMFQHYGCNMQFGGDDQWSNMLGGTELIRRKLGKDAYAMTITLLTDSQGKKMGKTAGNAVWLDPNKTSPFEFYQYWRNVDDADVLKCLRMLTDLPLEQIDEMDKWEGAQLNQAKEILAFELTKLVHSEEEARKAQDAARALFSQGGDKSNMPTTTLAAGDLTDGAVGVLDLMLKCGLVPSKKEARQARQKAARALEGRIQDELAQLDMPKVRFRTEFSPKAGEYAMDETGMDEVQFLMSANVGEDLKPIQKIASGGELARIMLVMKDVLSERDAVGTLVFDEIDEGVSGIAAQRVAEKLAHISRRKQVICVTHLPQIAAMADTHFHIEKRERGGRTYTAVTPLEREGRIREIARLHGGDNITDITLASAAEQLDAAEKYKQEGMG